MWDTFNGKRAFGFGVQKKPQGIQNGIQTGGILGKIRVDVNRQQIFPRTNFAEFVLGGGRNVKPGS